MIRFFVLGSIAETRGELFPLLKPFTKSTDFTDNERLQHYGISEKDWKWVESANEADLLIIPMAWNYYVRNNSQDEIINELQKYSVFGKPIWSFMTGDFGVAIPEIRQLSVFRTNGHKSKLPSNHQGLPVFIPDPLRKWYQRGMVIKRPFDNIPVVGFCGQANANNILALKDVIRTALRNLAYYLKIRKYLPQPLYSTTKLRAKLLDYCENTSELTCNFIRRLKYRAGVQNKTDRLRTAQEFYDNIKESDYIISVRGGGNFSVRFYETLAMGRIPVYVHTDGLLPLEDQIKWESHVVWVSYHDRKLIGERVKEFHSKLDRKEFEELLNKNRNLWIEKLSMDGFFKAAFHQEIKKRKFSDR